MDRRRWHRVPRRTGNPMPLRTCVRGVNFSVAPITYQAVCILRPRYQASSHDPYPSQFQF
jgi:hypothetical protein